MELVQREERFKRELSEKLMTSETELAKRTDLRPKRREF